MVAIAPSTVEPGPDSPAPDSEETTQPRLRAVSAPPPDSAVRRVMPPAERKKDPYIVLVGLDLSEPGGRAWRFAFDLAELRGEETEIHAVVIGARGMAPRIKDVATPRVSTSHASEAKLPPLKVLEHRSAGGQARLMAMHYRDGRPDKAIVNLAHEIGADLIVVASHPPSRLERLFGGPLADRIARNAPCPVVIVRPKRDEDDPGVDQYDPRLR
ncbi:universal stress protein [Polyangium sp. 15x6]|uniref:universal stress protein n=1 Tax=Polyangium sp. 15x6 TaxID=3042687 RepID=UPI00249C088F|nr:universal stress protein [Polyangium sp. 15x6]MDI3284868.1 universal stress protein [Polyangium sp. 15x6]